MHDLKSTLDDLERFAQKMADRGENVDIEQLERLAERRRELITKYNELRHEQRQAGEAMRTIDKKSDDAVALRLLW